MGNTITYKKIFKVLKTETFFQKSQLICLLRKAIFKVLMVGNMFFYIVVLFEVHYSKLNLLDLAGYEFGEDLRKDEVQLSNRSLQALQNCITALVERRKFIPYRDSRLTKLLRDSLGGDCITSMLAMIAPGDNQFEVKKTKK